MPLITRGPKKALPYLDFSIGVFCGGLLEANISPAVQKVFGASNIGALIIRTGFWCPIYYSYNAPSSRSRAQGALARGYENPVFCGIE